MGMFDSVMVPCPSCGERAEFQSKGGDCTLATYELHEAPSDVLSDVNRHAPKECRKCATRFSVETTTTSRVVSDVPGGVYMHEAKTRRHVLEALRWSARQPCMPDNCGTVCLCPPCHARAALEDLDPEWTP
jgi:hypothetical protein